MTRGTNNPGKARERVREDWRGKEARPLSTWPPPPLHSGPVRPRAHGLLVTNTMLLHTWVRL